jgi:hypothetical protein
MVEAFRIPQLLLDNSVGLHRAETNYQKMEMEIGNNNLESRESTAGIQTRCS